MNYKKILLCSVLVTGLLLTVGCTKKEETPSTEDQKLSTEISNKDTETNVKEESYNIVKKTIKNEYVAVSYPQVENMDGELTMDYINQALENALKNYIDEANKSKSKLSVDYEVTHKGQDILSIIFTGTQKHEGGEYKILHALNIDLNSTNQINAKNLIKQDEKSLSSMNKLIKEAAENNTNLKKEINGFADWMGVYFTDTELVFYFLENDFSTEYIKLQVPKKEAKPYLNTNFGEHPAS